MLGWHFLWCHIYSVEHMLPDIVGLPDTSNLCVHWHKCVGFYSLYSIKVTLQWQALSSLSWHWLFYLICGICKTMWRRSLNAWFDTLEKTRTQQCLVSMRKFGGTWSAPGQYIWKHHHSIGWIVTQVTDFSFRNNTKSEHFTILDVQALLSMLDYFYILFGLHIEYNCLLHSTATLWGFYYLSI